MGSSRLFGAICNFTIAIGCFMTPTGIKQEKYDSDIEKNTL